MNRVLIVVIELDVSRHPLLTHEHTHANRKSVRFCFVRGNLFYLERHIFELSEIQRIASYEPQANSDKRVTFGIRVPNSGPLASPESIVAIAREPESLATTPSGFMII